MKKYTRYLLTLCLGIHHACASNPSDQVWVPLKYANSQSNPECFWIKATKGQEVAQVKLVLKEIIAYQCDHDNAPGYHHFWLIKSGAYDEAQYTEQDNATWKRKKALGCYYILIPYDIQFGTNAELQQTLYGQADPATVDPDGSKFKAYLMQYIDKHITPDKISVRGYTDKELEDYFGRKPSDQLKGNDLTQAWIGKLKTFSLWGIYDKEWPVEYEVGMESEVGGAYYKDERLQDQKEYIQTEQGAFNNLLASKDRKLNTPTDIISYMDEETGTKTRPSNDQTGGLNQNGEPNDPGNRDPSDGSYTKFIIIGGGIVVVLLVGKYYTSKHSDKAPTKRKKKKA